MKFCITAEDKAGLCRQAPEFAALVQRTELDDFEFGGDLFFALVQSMVSQQLAMRAAEVIFARVVKLLGEISAANVLAADPVALRGCGLSGRKVEYLRGIATALQAGAIDFKQLATRPDDEVIADLITLKGVGVWTAEMLLIFALGRKDVLSFKDLGIRRGLMTLYGLESLSEDDFAQYRRRISPYGTLASLYLWRSKPVAGK